LTDSATALALYQVLSYRLNAINNEMPNPQPIRTAAKMAAVGDRMPSVDTIAAAIDVVAYAFIDRK
jgi:hypothetical protein